MARAFAVEDTGLGKTTTVKHTKNREYIDLDLSFAKKGSGDVYKKNAIASVKQALKVLLLTQRAEKPFSPFFGANLQEYLFELGDTRTLSDMRFAIEQNIKTFEPRINPNNLKIDLDFDEGNNLLNVQITFNVVNSSEEVTFTTQLNRLR